FDIAGDKYRLVLGQVVVWLGVAVFGMALNFEGVAIQTARARPAPRTHQPPPGLIAQDALPPAHPVGPPPHTVRGQGQRRLCRMVSARLFHVGDHSRRALLHLLMFGGHNMPYEW